MTVTEETVLSFFVYLGNCYLIGSVFHHRTDLFDQGTVSGRGALRNLSRILFTFVQGVDLITTDIVIDISLISFYLT